MDSQRRIGRGPSNRITRSWYPGGRARTYRGTGVEAEVTRSRGTSGLGTDVGYWGRVDSQGEFDEDAGFLEPHSGFPWRPVVSAVRRIVPLCAAALVGAVTALAWQSFLVRPTPPPVAQPALLATPTSARPAPQALLGSPPPRPASRASPEAEQPRSAPRIDRQAPPAQPRPPAVKVPKARVSRPAVVPGHPARSPIPTPSCDRHSSSGRILSGQFRAAFGYTSSLKPGLRSADESPSRGLQFSRGGSNRTTNRSRAGTPAASHRRASAW